MDAKSRARAAQYQAKAQALRAAARAREATAQATTQVTPLARSAQLTAGRGLYNARVWAAPRLERTGVAVQEELAPRISSAMTATARRIQPAPARRSLWPGLVAGVALLAAGGAAAVVLRSQRKSMAGSAPGDLTAAPSGGVPANPELPETTQADVNGQVRTP